MRGSKFPYLTSVLLTMNLVVFVLVESSIDLKILPFRQTNISGEIYNYKIPIIPSDIEKREAVKEAFLFAYNQYKSRCWGSDELTSSGGCTNYLKCGLTIVDSLSTLYLMGLNEEFEEATKFIENGLNPSGSWSSFEFIIRFVGGFLSAFQLSGKEIYLQRAVESADIIYNHRTSEGFFPGKITLGMKNNKIVGYCSGGVRSLAEIGTFQLEFLALSASTGDPKYAEMAVQSLKTLHKHNPSSSITSSVYGLSSFKGLGANIDSFYEYLSKMYILTNRTFEDSLTKHLDCIKDIKKSLLFITKENKHIGVGESHSGNLVPYMEHLAYFTGGMFIVGSVAKNPDWLQDFEIGKELATTIYYLNTQTKSGVSGEGSTFSSAERLDLKNIEFPIKREVNKREFHIRYPIYMLRPEGVESIYTAWKFSGEQKFRDYNWEIFMNINKTARNDLGFFNIADTDSKPSSLINNLESFFLAETLKYLYLTFDDSDKVSPFQYVFNTEAHPLKVWNQTSIEMLKNILKL